MSIFKLKFVRNSNNFTNLVAPLAVGDVGFPVKVVEDEGTAQEYRDGHQDVDHDPNAEE